MFYIMDDKRHIMQIWKDEYNIGIKVIDDQHRRILEYINDLEIILEKVKYDREEVGEVLNNIIDYTQSHFTFEETLQEQAQYQYRSPHKSVHDRFILKIESFRKRFLSGEEIEKELHKTLSKWLINHIQHDDADYVSSVKENMQKYIDKQEQTKGKGWFSKFFNRS